MHDFITLGTAPVDEPCVQLAHTNCYDTVRGECRRFIMLLRKTFGDEPLGARFAIKSFPHDFGEYHEAVYLFDTDDKAAHDAYRCEDELPASWEG
jgi:hypothetical protein